MKKPVILFCQENSIYKDLGCDVYDEKRNALNFEGGSPAVYHPPCRLWCKLKHFSTADESEKYLAVWSVRMVRNYGGVLEHPAGSSLFQCCRIPLPGQSDEFGFTIELDQFHFGHMAQKKTWLYICGISKDDPVIKYREIPGKPKYMMSESRQEKLNGAKEVPKQKRSSTPKRFAKFLIRIVNKIEDLKSVKKRPDFNNLKVA